ncbi:hypothetical protein [Aromatoleum toluclasticum]|uniref:hypothetical protein n=1 Tax=Aromatoleum toluclasticum TaxID=92003 RepID=UPI00035C229B|nr:hypothetical protein [Aromatoleum toluclasticum]
MKLFSEQDQSTRQALGSHINQRWSQLYELDKEWSERALKYLLMTNSGGAIATLSFLGAAPAAIGMLGAKIALLVFLAGVVLVGVAVAKTFHHMRNLFESWKTEVTSYYEDRITWQHLQDEDKKRAVADWWDYGIPYASFACFIGGCIAGAWSLLTRAGQ